MKVIGIIPARYASTRFPGKPLIDIGGKSMIQRVYEQALKAGLHDVIVATDDNRIKDAVLQFGGSVVITSPNHSNGTERIAEVAAAIEADVVINIQGDEPFIEPEQIRLLAHSFNDSRVDIATLAIQSNDSESFARESIVKVVLDNAGRALYFSRSPIPCYRSGVNHGFYKHIGIYAFRKDVLLQLVQLPTATLEEAEMLEQLRWLQAGYSIKVLQTNKESIAIDVPEDLAKAMAYLGLQH